MSEKNQSASEAPENTKPKTSSKTAPKSNKASDVKVVAQDKAQDKTQDKADFVKVTASTPKAEVTKEAVGTKTTVGTVKVTQVGSSIARNNSQGRTLIGLGLGKIGRSRILESTPSVHGMINKVKHLVKTEAA